MPIKPENRARYPANWNAIRAGILERAGHRCEQCGLPNYIWVLRGDGDHKGFTLVLGTGTHKRVTTLSNVSFKCNKTGLPVPGPTEFKRKKSLTRIVLTLSHQDHIPENNEASNLKAFCQSCHINYDLDFHQANAAATRAAKKAAEDGR